MENEPPPAAMVPLEIFIKIRMIKEKNRSGILASCKAT